MSALTILRAAEIHAPEPRGKGDLLIASGKILTVGESFVAGKSGSRQLVSSIDADSVDCSGLRVIPGLIDGHVHVAGAGGEGGPATRTPEVLLSQLLAGGITSVVGCLGTDGYTRTPESVLMKVKGLRREGVSAWMLTGAYQIPPPTITGDVGKDIALIDEIIGVGEVAISDHRANHVDVSTLIDLASKARVGGMLGGKAGIVQLHMGDAKDPLRPILAALASSMIPANQFMPTHMNRNRWIFEDGKAFGKAGGRIDLTASGFSDFPGDELKPSKAVKELMSAGVPLDRITISSDGNGSLPEFDDIGRLVRLELGQPLSIYREMVDMVREEGLSLETALAVVTRNPAAAYALPAKGRIEAGYDADLVVVDGDWNIVHLVAGGEFLIRNGRSKKGTFET